MAELKPDFSSYKLMPLKKLVKAPWNYKEDDEARKNALKASIKRNNQIVNMNVRELDTGFYEVIDGNHRLDALNELGFKEAVVYDQGKISVEEAQRKAVEINENRFFNDTLKFAEIVVEMHKMFSYEDMAETTPFTATELEHFGELTKFDWEQYKQAPKADGDESDKVEFTLEVKREVYERWMAWRERCLEILGYDAAEKCFELAVIEALNVPQESLQ